MCVLNLAIGAAHMMTTINSKSAFENSIIWLKKKLINYFHEKLGRIGEKISTGMNQMKAELTEALSAKNDEIVQLEQEATFLSNEVKIVENSLEDQDAYQRRDTIIIAGLNVPVETENKNCSAVVQKLL